MHVTKLHVTNHPIGPPAFLMVLFSLALLSSYAGSLSLCQITDSVAEFYMHLASLCAADNGASCNIDYPKHMETFQAWQLLLSWFLCLLMVMIFPWCSLPFLWHCCGSQLMTPLLLQLQPMFSFWVMLLLPLLLPFDTFGCTSIVSHFCHCWSPNLSIARSITVTLGTSFEIKDFCPSCDCFASVISFVPHVQVIPCFLVGLLSLGHFTLGSAWASCLPSVPSILLSWLPSFNSLCFVQFHSCQVRSTQALYAMLVLVHFLMLATWNVIVCAESLVLGCHRWQHCSITLPESPLGSLALHDFGCTCATLYHSIIMCQVPTATHPPAEPLVNSSGMPWPNPNTSFWPGEGSDDYCMSPATLAFCH